MSENGPAEFDLTNIKVRCGMCGMHDDTRTILELGEHTCIRMECPVCGDVWHLKIDDVGEVCPRHPTDP